MQQRRLQSSIMIGCLSLALCVGAALTHSQAQAAGKGPYYAEPAWDQKIEPAQRFLVMTDWNSEAVLDRETGLVWEKTPTATPVENPTSWLNARLTCANKSVGGRKGWRLPSMPELASLVDPTVTPAPTLPPGHPFTNVQSASYWSATANSDVSIGGVPAYAWGVTFDGGVVFSTGKTGIDIFRAWCVRGGMNADAY
jgi:hypothetical protein